MQEWIFDIRSRKFFSILVFFIVLTFLVYAKITSSADHDIMTFAQSIGGYQPLDVIMQVLTEIGNIEYMIIFSILLFIKKSTRRLGLILILSVLAGTIVSSYLKCSAGQERPNLDFAGTIIFPPEPDSTIPCKIDGSFPSGHTTRTISFAFIIGFALSRRFPRGCYIIWAYPILISISRIYVLEHSPTDVIGGVLLGIIVSNVISKKLKLRLIFEKLET